MWIRSSFFSTINTGSIPRRTEIGFHADEAILLAASLTIDSEMHPESEIDKVTTPKGITISGLNEIEHQGFSSAMIRAIVRSADKIDEIINES